MNAEDLKTAATVGGFLLVLSGVLRAWISWRAESSTRLNRMDQDLKALAEQQEKQAQAQREFEREVRTSYVTVASISELRAALDRGFAALTERVDKLMSR